ncbi:MAG: NADH-quinone oxidoreductase subunit J [Thermodesulfobacteriota bacterium]
MIESVFVVVCMMLAVVCALWVVFSKNTIYSALWMIGFCLVLAVLFLLLRLEFIALLQVIVYAGAIMMFIIYAVMMLNLRMEARLSRILKTKLFGLALLIIFLFYMAPLVNTTLGLGGKKGSYTLELLQQGDGVRYLSVTMFSDYLITFELVSVLLTAGIVGAVALTKK